MHVDLELLMDMEWILLNHIKLYLHIRAVIKGRNL